MSRGGARPGPRKERTISLAEPDPDLKFLRPVYAILVQPEADPARLFDSLDRWLWEQRHKRFTARGRAKIHFEKDEWISITGDEADA